MMNAQAEQHLKNVGPSKIDVAYQRFGNPDSPAAFLIMGGGAQMNAWPEGFCMELVSRGLQVIRFDNRDVGLSTHFTDAPVPDFPAVMAGEYKTVSYTLSDMAADTVGLMDALGFESVHLIGASLGGMIAQTIAIEYPSRVRSLTSMMSSTGNKAVGQTDYSVFTEMGSPPYNDREAFIKWRVKCLKIIGSARYPLDEEGAAERAGVAWDRDHDPVALFRQSVAVIKSGDRTNDLRHINTPTLVIHGKADRMIDASGGIATAEAIPKAQLSLFDDMGHMMPQELWAEFANLISNLVMRSKVREV
jgi:pimeloyl-ACP methyl ester carboxylesterase